VPAQQGQSQIAIMLNAASVRDHDRDG